MSREAMKLALEALKNFEKAGLATLKTIDAIIALKQALEQPEPEPVAWANRVIGGRKWLSIHASKGASDKWLEYRIKEQAQGEKYEQVALYTSQPKREWQVLTDEEIYEMDDLTDEPSWEQILRFVRAVEAKLKERNT